MKKLSQLIIIIFFIFLLTISAVVNVKACKDIIACGDATDGEYNLLLKVRDPSRPGLQVLCIVPEGYQYTYRHPWTGNPIDFTTNQKYIGVASKGDTIPDITKAGMTLSAAGIAYGDADTNSKWINPTKNAWDDFDWIRYACQTAETEEQAIKLLTEDAVKNLHATGVSENLFLVGPDKGYMVEGDAYRYKIHQIENGILLSHNYPKELWKTQIMNTRLISKSYDTNIQKTIRKNNVIRLGAFQGIKLKEIGENYVKVDTVGIKLALRNIGKNTLTKINLGESETLGPFRVTLLDIQSNKATLEVTTKYKAWEDLMLQNINQEYGNITIKEMINWSRYTNEDLNGLRGLCQPGYSHEAVAIYKIPEKNYQTMSMGWFAPNHACSSIYVPFHVTNTEIYGPYENGDAAQICLDLLDKYELKKLGENFSKTENVFITELDNIEGIIKNALLNEEDTAKILTINDISMQKQGYLTEQIWTIAHEKELKTNNYLSIIWDTNYSQSLENQKNIISEIKTEKEHNEILEKIIQNSIDICRTRIDILQIINNSKTKDINEIFTKATHKIELKNYEEGYNLLQKSFEMSTNQLEGKKTIEKTDEKNEFLNINLLVFIIGLAIINIVVAIVFRRI